MPLSHQISEINIARWVATLLCVAFAGLVAILIGQSQVLLLSALVAAAGATAIIVGLRKRIWLLILFGWAFTGTVNIFSLPLSVRAVCILLGFIGYLAYRILTAEQAHVRWNTLDYLLLANMCWIGVTFVINPVGVRALGAETMGGRPYFGIAMAALAYWAIVRLPDSPTPVAKIPYFILTGFGVVALMNVIVYVFPATTPYLWRFYGGVDVTGYLQSGGIGNDAGQRWYSLQGFGITTMLVLAAAFRPLSLFHIIKLRFYCFALGMAAILATGFRNALLWTFASLGLGSWLHRGWRECVTVGLVGVIFLSVLILGHGRLYELPFAAQRALAFFPGDWSAEVIQQTSSSSEGRFEWWRIVIKEKLIKNWWVGDGFGVKRSDFTALARSGKFFEWYTLTGSFHNGPLSAIRYAGLVGLVLFYALMIGAAIWSVRLVRQLNGHPLQFTCLFLAIQFLWTPIHYTFVFGAYESELPQYIFLAGLLRLVQRMVEQEQTRQSPVTATGVMPHRLPLSTAR